MIKLRPLAISCHLTIRAVLSLADLGKPGNKQSKRMTLASHVVDLEQLKYNYFLLLM